MKKEKQGKQLQVKENKISIHDKIMSIKDDVQHLKTKKTKKKIEKNIYIIKGGEYLFKNIVSKNLREYCELYPLKIGITNIAVISNKISQLKNEKEQIFKKYK